MDLGRTSIGGMSEFMEKLKTCNGVPEMATVILEMAKCLNRAEENMGEAKLICEVEKEIILNKIIMGKSAEIYNDLMWIVAELAEEESDIEKIKTTINGVKNRLIRVVAVMDREDATLEMVKNII